MRQCQHRRLHQQQKDELDNPENEEEDNEVITIDEEETEVNEEISKEQREKEPNREEIMVINETKETTKVNNPRETSKSMVNQNATEKPDEERTQTSPPMRQKVSKSVGKQRTPPKQRALSGTSSQPTPTSSPPTSSPRLRTSTRSRTPEGKRNATNKALLVIPGSKRKFMADYSKKEKLVEHTETHLDLLLKISALREK